SRLSRTAASGRPTIVNTGTKLSAARGVKSISTSTTYASMPKTAALTVLNSICRASSDPFLKRSAPGPRKPGGETFGDYRRKTAGDVIDLIHSPQAGGSTFEFGCLAWPDIIKPTQYAAFLSLGGIDG